MTKLGYGLLNDELTQKKREVRSRIIRDIQEARAHGDLSENAEYKAAKEEQRHNDRRVRYLERRLSNAQVIDPSEIKLNKVAFGATVALIDEENNDITYQIVGEDEAKIENNTISIFSPVARALIGLSEGDEAIIKTPGGERSYEVVRVKYQ